MPAPDHRFFNGLLGAKRKAKKKIAKEHCDPEKLRRTKHTDNTHITRAKNTHKSKFKKPAQIKKLENRTIKNPDRVGIQRNGRIRFEKDFGRVVGTKGEKTMNVVVDPSTRKVVTSFPSSGN